MHDQQDVQKTTVEIMDAYDHAIKLRASIGYLADTAQSDQLAALLWTIEESAEILENLLKFLVEGERESKIPVVAEDVPFD